MIITVFSFSDYYSFGIGAGARRRHQVSPIGTPLDRVPRRSRPPGHLRGHAGHLQLSGAKTIHQKYDQGKEAQVQWR